MTKIESWGRLSTPSHTLVTLSSVTNAPDIIAITRGPSLPFGNGRSYGDSCLNPSGTLWETRTLDRLISFSSESGLLTCEPGVLLADIQRLLIPRGWTLPVTPGTQLITVGGAIANDVHGKNHHRHGSFCDHVTALELARTDGKRLTCSKEHNTDWFTATAGGLGLTGVILSATIQLKTTCGPWLTTESIPYHSLDEFFLLSDESESEWEHTVSWIDCTCQRGVRGIFMRGNPSPRRDIPEERPQKLSVPFIPPISLVNRFSLPLFNSIYFRQQSKRAGIQVQHYKPFFYPLDAIKHWNRAYGRRGFYQYQSVVPRKHREDATAEMLNEIKRSGQGSMLAVLKTFGARQPPGLMSFPMEGATLALDFPNRNTTTLKLFERLDAIVREAHGRIYPAKDARMPRELFELGYPNLQKFQRFRDPGISSALSRRLTGS